MTIDARGRPAGRFEPRDLIARFRQPRRAVDRNAVVVEENDEAREAQVTGEADRLVADAFHQIAVGGDDIGVVIDEIIAEARRENALGERHADGGRDALTERARRRLDAGAVAVLGMARARAARADGSS